MDEALSCFKAQFFEQSTHLFSKSLLDTCYVTVYTWGHHLVGLPRNPCDPRGGGLWTVLGTVCVTASFLRKAAGCSLQKANSKCPRAGKPLKLTKYKCHLYGFNQTSNAVPEISMLKLQMTSIMKSIYAFSGL